MPSLIEEISDKAASLRVPLTVQLDLTYRCNQRCVHCYVEGDDHSEMTTMHDYAGVQALAADLGAVFTMDPTVTPKMNGDRSVTALRGPSPLDCEKSYARTGISTPF
jgi:hypothetical protein